MSTKTHYFRIGLFVICTIVILVVGIIWVSLMAFGRKTILLETYIDESVLGLSVGSQVMQRGVEIGRVEKITFVPREYDMVHGGEAFNKYSKYVMVIMAIDTANFPEMPADLNVVRVIVQQWVRSGLRIKLAYQGITGIAYLEADYVDPARFVPMEIEWQPRNIYIPSAPSTLTNFTQAIDTVFQRLDRIDFEGIADSLDKTLTSLSKAVDDVRPAETRKELTGLISEFRQTNKLVQALMNTESREGTSIPEAIERFNKTLKLMDEFVLGQQSEFEEVVANIKRASANLRELTEYAKRYPSQVIFGPAPPRSEVVE